MPRPAEPLDLTRYAPFYWSAIANRWTALSSRTYIQRFGIGVVEWRLLATLGARGAATAQDASRLAAIDPGAASRAMNQLRRKGLVAPLVGRFAGRSKPFEMTPSGVELFDRVNTLAQQRAEEAMDTLTAAEKNQFLRLLHRVYARLNEMPEP